jgi:hypothetical protein
MKAEIEQCDRAQNHGKAGSGQSLKRNIYGHADRESLVSAEVK